MVNPGPYPGLRSNMKLQGAFIGSPAAALAFAPITVPDLVASTVVDTAMLPVDLFSLGRRTQTVYEKSGEDDILDVFTMRYNRKGQLDGRTILIHHLPSISYESGHATWGESPMITQSIEFRNGLAIGESIATEPDGSGGDLVIAKGSYKDGKEHSGTFFLRDKKSRTGGYILEFNEGKQVSKKPYRHKQVGKYECSRSDCPLNHGSHPE